MRRSTEADSYANGVAERILAAPYVNAILTRKGQWSYEMTCSDPAMAIMRWDEKDEVTDSLLNRFNREYYRFE